MIDGGKLKSCSASLNLVSRDEGTGEVVYCDKEADRGRALVSRDEIVKLAAVYAAVLRKHNAVAVELPDLSILIDPCDPSRRQVFLNHVLWACLNIPKVIDRLGGHEHCHRWLGRVEGVFVAYGLMSVEEVRELMNVQIHPIYDEHSE